MGVDESAVVETTVGMDTAMRPDLEAIKKGAYPHGPSETDMDVLIAYIEELEARLTIVKPHPFPDDYDAVDLLNDRVKILKAREKKLREALEEIICQDYLKYGDNPLADVIHIADAALREGE